LPEAISANREIPKQHSWESCPKSILTSQPEEEEEPDDKTDANEFSLYSVGSSSSHFYHLTPPVMEPHMEAPKGQEKAKEGSRLVRKLKKFRKGKQFLLVYEVKECVELYLHSPNMSSWHGAQLKYKDNFTFYLLYICIET
jgi:hypothetical protein